MKDEVGSWVGRGRRPRRNEAVTQSRKTGQKATLHTSRAGVDLEVFERSAVNYWQPLRARG